MTSLDALLALAAAVALGGFGPMAYVLLRQWRDRRAQATALRNMHEAQRVLESGSTSDPGATAEALARFDTGTIDRTIEQLTSKVTTPEQRTWFGQLVVQLGALERFTERARSAHTWNERAHAVRVLGNLGLPAAVPTLATVLRDRDEDEAVRALAADALAAIRDPSVIPQLIAELRRADDQATPRVAEALIPFGSAATQALLELLDEKEHTPARVWAARVLTATHDSAAVEALIARLRDRHDLLRANSAEALGAIGDQRALPPLMQVALRDPAPIVRGQAAVAAAKIAGPEATALLVAALGDPDFATRLRALEAFESMRLSDTSALEHALGDSNAEVRKRAALALERLGYLDKLVERLASEDRKVRTTAYTALIQLGRAGLIEGIAGRIRHESMLVRAAIAKACGELGLERSGPALLAALNDSEWPVRASLCEAIGLLRPKGGGLALSGMLSDPEESVREAAANALASYAGSGIEVGHNDLLTAYEKGSVPIRLSMIAAAAGQEALGQILIDALRDPSEVVRLRALSALATRPLPAAIGGLIAALTDASVEVRMAAVPALGTAGTAEAFEALLRTLPGAQPALRERIAEALSGVARTFLLQSIDELKRDESLDLRLGIAWTLGKIGDPVGVPVLTEFLGDREAALRASAAGALGKIPVAASVNALLAAVDDREPKIRAAVVNALGKVGGQYPGVRESLVRRLHDPDAFVRNRAAIALSRAAGAEVADLARSAETARLIDGPALVLMQGLAGTPETIALALQALGDPARLPAIQRFFDREEPAVCAAFLTALKLTDTSNHGLNTRLDPEALAAQYEQLLRSSRDGKERRTAVEALSGIKTDRKTQAFADALAADPEDSVRLRCAQVLSSQLDNDVAKHALIRAIADPNPQVAVTAIEGLRSLPRTPQVAEVLFRRLGASSLLVNQAVEQALAELYRDDPISFIDRAMGSDQPDAIVAALRVLEWMAHPSTLPLFVELLKSQNAEVRAATIRAAAKTGLAEARSLTDKMLDDPSEQVRIAALEVIATDSIGALSRLSVARSDPSVQVRCRLCHLLGRFPEPAAKDIVNRLLEDTSPQVRAAAMVTTLTFGDVDQLKKFSTYWAKAPPETQRHVPLDPRGPAATRKLANVLIAGGDSATRELAVMAIAALATEGYEQLLLPVLRDPRPGVRLAAAHALSGSLNADVRRQLRELVQDPEAAVREAVRAAALSLPPS